MNICNFLESPWLLEKIYINLLKFIGKYGKFIKMRENCWKLPRFVEISLLYMFFHIFLDEYMKNI